MQLKAPCTRQRYWHACQLTPDVVQADLVRPLLHPCKSYTRVPIKLACFYQFTQLALSIRPYGNCANMECTPALARASLVADAVLPEIRCLCNHELHWGAGRTLSSRIFCTMNVATVLDSSLPISIVRRHSGMISVDSRNAMTSVSSTCQGAGQPFRSRDFTVS